jgi:hypothetical protein
MQRESFPVWQENRAQGQRRYPNAELSLNYRRISFPMCAKQPHSNTAQMVAIHTSHSDVYIITSLTRSYVLTYSHVHTLAYDLRKRRIVLRIVVASPREHHRSSVIVADMYSQTLSIELDVH